MAKSTSEKAKTTKTEAAKPAEKKTTAKKAADSTAKPAAKAAPKKATTPKAATNPADTLAKKAQEVIEKLDKMGDTKYQEVKEKLQWCLGSYGHDKNPSGLIEHSQHAVGALKEIREEKPKAVPQKLIDDIEKALAKI